MNAYSSRGFGRAVLAVALLLIAAGMPVYAANTVLVFGDSLSAAHGIARSDGWVALLGERLAAGGGDVEVVNASVSGETTAGGRRRLAAALASHEPAVVVLELGANDGLRAQSLQHMKANLAAMIEASRAAGAQVLLLGMRIPSNYGKAYTEHFHAVFDDLVERYDVAYVSFFLAPLVEKNPADRSQFQADGIHPKAAAEPALLDHVWPKLSALLAPLTQTPAEP